MPQTPPKPTLSAGCRLALDNPRRRSRHGGVSVPYEARFRDGLLTTFAESAKGRYWLSQYHLRSRTTFHLAAGTDADLATLRGLGYLVEDAREVAG